MLCQGQTIAISDYATLYNLIGTTYGGDGQSTFNLPDLRGRSPIHQGTSAGGAWVMGQIAGTETVTLTSQQVAPHVHGIGANSTASSATVPTNGTFGPNSTLDQFDSTPNAVSAPLLAASGPALPHDNLMPFLTGNYIISLYGIYPTQS
jgi:microcystin-dependent protein